MPKCVTEEETTRSPRVADRSLSAADGCDWLTEVGDVQQCQSMQCLVRQQTKLELDALQDGKTVDDHFSPSELLQAEGFYRL